MEKLKEISEPQIEIVYFAASDVICTSGEPYETEDQPFDPNA